MTATTPPRCSSSTTSSDTCRNLSDILTDLGYRVDCAHDGPTALELVRRRPYDVALLDLRMPGMDGLTLYREIKKLRAGTVAILVTAYASGATSEEALAAGAWQVLPKPVDLPRAPAAWSTRRSASRWSWSSTTTASCARTSGRSSASGATASPWPTTRPRRPSSSGTRPFRVVLIDMKLPGGDGAEVFRLVREANPEARTVLITGCRAETDALVERVLAEGADAVCYKPFDVPRLLG